jgi:eukaryotic-like serine/threonine-protein kinase
MAFTCIRCNREIDRAFKACPHCGETITDFLREYADKPIDGKYRIVQRLGIGGMGEVFKVEHTFLGSTRVVKIIRAQISSSSDAHDRFLREARLATKVQHPNVATLHDFSALPDGSHYMVWEFIEGENLAQLIRRRGTLPAKHAVRIAIQALAGLDAIHRAGIVHRDISPENLMITHASDGSEFVKIIDLGVAKATESDVAMTQTGMFVGKFRYASPDHLGFLPVGERIDGRADLYSLAVVLYEMLTGRPPFEATSPHEYIIHHSRDEYLNSQDLDRVTGSPALQAVLARALDRDRNKRFATARELADALAAIEPSLTDEASQTIAGPFDADATMKTERTNSGQTHPPGTTVPATTAQGTVAPTTATVATATPPATVATSAPAMVATATVPSSTGSGFRPGEVPAAATVIETMPGSAPRRSMGAAVAIAVLAILLLGAVAVIAVMRFWRTHEIATKAATPATTTTTSSAKPSQATVDVTPPTPVLINNTTAISTTSMTTTATPSTTATTASVAPPTTTHAPPKPPRTTTHEEPPPAEEPAVEPEPAPVPSSANAPTYREKGDGNGNDAALAALHQQIGGVTRVAVSGGDAEMIKQLSDALRGRGITIGEGAPIEIRFTGYVERHGLGRKSRSANATIKKNGRPIFQYVMPREEYRVGDSPAEAFARILGDALTR